MTKNSVVEKLPSVTPGEDEWSEVKDSADMVSIKIRFASGLTDAEVEEVWTVNTWRTAWSSDWLIAQLFDIKNQHKEGYYTFDTSTRITEWGASGGFVEHVLTMGHDFADEATLVAMGALIAKLKDKLLQTFGTQENETFSEEEATSDALDHLVADKGIERDVLEVKAYSAPEEHSCSIEILDKNSGVLYGVQITSEGGVRSGRVWKIVQP